uniref:uncharacterized protein LOC122600737 n=1 Tax=Erigeron canadensis TaxID=72917 RepID=UPI001CB9931C|nr:uncharacterized protein LOC122600737 [Erigeron canadensis]
MIVFTLSEAPRFPSIFRRFTRLAASVGDPTIFIMLSDYQQLVKLWYDLSRLAENQNIRDLDSDDELSINELQELLEGDQNDPIVQRKARLCIGILCLSNPSKDEKKPRKKNKANGGSDNSLKLVLKADYELKDRNIQFDEDVRIVFGALSDGGYYVKEILYK